MDKPSTNPESGLPHPLLKAAIRSLNLQQEEEIARYQRQHQPLASPQASIPTADVPTAAEASSTAAPGNSMEAVSSENSVKMKRGRESVSAPTEFQTQLGTTQVLETAPKQAHSILPQGPNTGDALSADTNELTSYHSHRLLTPLGISAVLLMAATTVLALAMLAPERLRITAQWFNPASPVDTNESMPEASVLEANKLAAETVLAPSSSASVPVPPVPAAPTAPQSSAGCSSGGCFEQAQPEVESPYSDLTSALLPPSLRPQQSDPSAAPPVAPILKPTQPIDVPIAEVEANYYYVLAQYTGELSLKAAQEAVPNAKLARFAEGVRIQMGAFQQLEEAHRLVEKLQPLGITAAVYGVDS